MNTLTHTILDKHDIKNINQLKWKSCGCLYNEIQDEVPEEYHMDAYDIRLNGKFSRC